MAQGANPNNIAQPRTITPTSGAPSVFNQSSQAYTDALAATRNAAGMQVGQAQAYGYTPQQAQAGGYTAAGAGSQGYNASTIGATDLSRYMNPYTDQVINNSMRSLNDAQQTSLNQLGASATAAGAFGGSRHGIAEAMTNAEYGKQASDMVAGLRQAGFQNAQQMALADIGALNQAGAFGANAANTASLANQAAVNAARQFGVGAQNTVSLANQNAANAAGSQFAGAQNAASLANQNASFQNAQLGLQSAAQLGGLSQQGFNYGTTLNQQQMQQGALQQQQQQQLIDAAKLQYGGFTGSPQNALQLLMAATGAGNMGQQTTTQTKQNGPFDYLTAFLSMMPRG